MGRYLYVLKLCVGYISFERHGILLPQNLSADEMSQEKRKK